jgi:hypothetical protein
MRNRTRNKPSENRFLQNKKAARGFSRAAFLCVDWLKLIAIVATASATAAAKYDDDKYNPDAAIVATPEKGTTT